MKKVLIIVGIALIVIVGILLAIGAYMKSATKVHSPLETVVFNQENAKWCIVVLTKRSVKYLAN